MKEVKVSLLEGDMILNIEKSKDYVCVHTHTHTHTHTVLKLINIFNNTVCTVTKSTHKNQLHFYTL